MRRKLGEGRCHFRHSGVRKTKKRGRGGYAINPWLGDRLTGIRGGLKSWWALKNCLFLGGGNMDVSKRVGFQLWSPKIVIAGGERTGVGSFLRKHRSAKREGGAVRQPVI